MSAIYYHAAPAPAPARRRRRILRPALPADPPEGWGIYVFPEAAHALEWVRRHMPESRAAELHRFRLRPGSRVCEPTTRAEDLDAVYRALGLEGALALARGLDEHTGPRFCAALSRAGFDALLTPHFALVFSPAVLEWLGGETRPLGSDTNDLTP